MTRISLKEAYDNRDVIAQLVSLRDDVDELLNILKDINPDGDLTNIVTKTGDQTIDGVKTFIGKIVADCDIIQNGAAYETHAEQIFTHNDYIVTRDGALGGLQPGEFSGFRVNKYDSVHDGHLVMDSSGVARVGDVNDEQPLATRDEAANLNNDHLLIWDAAAQFVKDSGINKSEVVPTIGSGGDGYYVKIGQKTYLCFGVKTCNIQNQTSVSNYVDLPITAANGNYPVFVSRQTLGAYWANLSYSVSARTTTSFTISTRLETANTVTETGAFAWLAVVTVA